MTPRKTSRRQHHHHAQPTPLVQASDYESDINYVPPPPRTNDEINLSVLKRYNPSIRSILSIAASATVYSFKEDPPAWEKSGIEGALFVCQQEPHPRTGSERYCIAILNRRGLENLILELAEILDVEKTNELITLRFVEKVATDLVEGPTKTIGLWMHPDKDDTRELNGVMIENLWKKAVAGKSTEPLAEGSGKQRDNSSSTESWNMVPNQLDQQDQSSSGRRLSLKDLFGQQQSILDKSESEAFYDDPDHYDNGGFPIRHPHR